MLISFLRGFLSGAALAAPTVSASFAAGKDAGMLAFNNHCRQCHSYKQGDNRLGPSLYGVVGRKSGTAPSYGNYSDSLKNAGITWTPEQLEKWIADPEAVVPNNNMKPYPGVADADQRRQIVEFLKADTQRDGKSSAAGGAQ